MSEQDELEKAVEAWEQLNEAVSAAIDAIPEIIEAIVEIWELIKQAARKIIELLAELGALFAPLWRRLWFYRRLRHRCQWIPERWAAFVAWRCPLWLVRRL